MEHKYSVAQFSMSDNYDENIAKADKMIEKAAKEGAELLLLPELFEGLYFCQVEDYEKYFLAEEAKNSKTLAHFQEMAKKYHIVLPISFFEKSGPVYFNSLAIIDADGTILGIYHRRWTYWRGHLLGSVVPRNRPYPYPPGCPGSSLPKRDWLRAGSPER